MLQASAVPPDKSHKDYFEWSYAPSEASRWDIEFTPTGVVREIACFSTGSDECPTLFGIRDGSTEEDVRQQLGAPADEKLDGVTKRMRYPAFNVTVHLKKRRVYWLRVSQDTVP